MSVSYSTYTGSPGVSAVAALSASEEPTGFENRTDSELTWDNATRTLTISRVATNFKVWVDSVKYTYTSALTSTITDTEGWWFFWVDTAGALQNSQTFPGINSSTALVAFVYWDATNKRILYTGIHDERHGINMSSESHYWKHYYAGTQIVPSDFAITYDTIVSVPTSDNKTRFYLAGGELSDEDLHYDIVNDQTPTNPFEQDLGTGTGHLTSAKVPVLYKSGATGVWRSIDVDAFRFPFAYSGANGPPQWNEWDGSTWKLTDPTDKYRIAYWVCSSNSEDYPIFMVPGQAETHYLKNVDRDIPISGIDWGTDQFAELRILYRIVYRYKSTYGSSTHRCKIERVDDFRGQIEAYGSSAGTASSHAALTNLDYDSSGHTDFQRSVNIDTVAPTADNDSEDTATYGTTFHTSDLWVDRSVPMMYICTDSTSGAAVWEPIGGLAESTLASYETTVQAAAVVVGGGAYDPDSSPNAEFHCVLSTSDATKTVHCQLYSLTDATQICDLTTTSTTPVLKTQALSLGVAGANTIADSAKIYEIRIWVASGTGAESAILHSAKFVS